MPEHSVLFCFVLSSRVLCIIIGDKFVLQKINDANFVVAAFIVSAGSSCSLLNFNRIFELLAWLPL